MPLQATRFGESVQRRLAAGPAPGDRRRGPCVCATSRAFGASGGNFKGDVAELLKRLGGLREEDFRRNLRIREGMNSGAAALKQIPLTRPRLRNNILTNHFKRNMEEVTMSTAHGSRIRSARLPLPLV